MRFARLAAPLAVAVAAIAASPANATVTAQGVALNASADCTNADLDLTFISSGALRESGLITNLAGQTLGQFEQSTTLGNFTGTFVGYGQPVSPTQPAGTIIGSYAYIGTTPPQASTTGEFFILYNCSTRQVLRACFGPFGTCPQTALQAQALVTAQVPTLSEWGLVTMSLVLSAAALAALRRRRV